MLFSSVRSFLSRAIALQIHDATADPLKAYQGQMGSTSYFKSYDSNATDVDILLKEKEYEEEENEEEEEEEEADVDPLSLSMQGIYSLCLSVCLSVCLSICLSVFANPLCLI